MHRFWILGFRRSRKISSQGCVKGANSWITGAAGATDCHDAGSPVIHQFAGFAQPVLGLEGHDGKEYDWPAMGTHRKEGGNISSWPKAKGSVVGGIDGGIAVFVAILQLFVVAPMNQRFDTRS